jgi:hypothetical protein
MLMTNTYFEAVNLGSASPTISPNIMSLRRSGKNDSAKRADNGIGDARLDARVTVTKSPAAVVVGFPATTIWIHCRLPWPATASQTPESIPVGDKWTFLQ